MSIRVAIVDSGINFPTHARRNFSVVAADANALGHGSAIARRVLAAAPDAELLDARIFAASDRCDPARVVAAIDWAVELGAQVINLSFGQRAPNAALRAACTRAAVAGVLLVASAPARGRPVFPAAYANCIAVSGDARCAAAELSWLGAPGIDFGACPRIDDMRPELGGGASFAAARVSGRIAALLAAGLAADAVFETLRGECRLVGPERRASA